MLDKKIYILMPIYNGEKYLYEQVKSIQNQQYRNWKLVVRDDGSTDESLGIMRLLAASDLRIDLLQDQFGQLGVIGNIKTLMEHALQQDAEYVCLADQDDVWLPDKLSKQVWLMSEMERQYGDLPILVHSDLKVVDKDLSLIHPSFMAYQGIRHEYEDPLRVLLLQNFVTGCTIMINRSLLERALPIAESALMHDWWLALVAATFGKIGFLPDATVLYRQHDGNTVGAKGFWRSVNPFRRNRAALKKQGMEHLMQTTRQAEAFAAFLQQGDADVDRELLSLVVEYASMMRLSPLRRFYSILRLGVRRQGLVRQGFFLFSLLRIPEDIR